MKENIDFKPRNDFVLIRIVDKGEIHGIAMPDTSIQGKEFHVIAIGPKVVGLEVGDLVLMIGTQGQDYAPLPTSKDLMVIKESNIILIVGHEES